MKIYIILTNTMGGVSGGSGYANNKSRFIQDKGWNVVVIDSYGLKGLPVVLDNLKPFAKNRFSELFYPPSLFSSPQVKNTINKLCALVDRSAEQIVVESNTVVLSLWGELFARELKAKHLVFIIGEAKKIDSLDLFDFYKFKYEHNEIFSIKKEMFELLFSPYMNISDAGNRYWSANCAIPPQEVELSSLDTIEKADFNIVVFGRYKGFFPFMINELCMFANSQRGKTINLIFFGETALDSFKKQLAAETNMNCHYFASQVPVPKSLFRLADVVIAASGCANVSFSQGAKTISMDVFSHRPIGLMGYTTISTVTASANDNEDMSLYQLLEELLVKRNFSGPCVMKRRITGRSNDYQLTFVDGPAHFWGGDVKKINRKVKFPSGILKIVFRLGLEPFVSKQRYVLMKLSKMTFY